MKQLFIFFLILNSTLLFSQEKVIVENTTDSTISIKCFLQNTFSKEGINYYRSNDNGKSWTKLNQKVIKLGVQTPDAPSYKKDKSLKDYTEIASNIDPNKDNGFVDITILFKAVLSSDFAKYIGIQFDDNTFVKGDEYIYKATKYINGKEFIIGISDEIIAGSKKEFFCPKNIELSSFEKEIKIKWEPEEERYFGVNVYRRNEDAEKFIKVNDFPVIVTQATNNEGEKVYPEFFFQEDSLKNGVKYYYKLEAINYFGLNSSLSNEIIATPRDITPPKPPLGLDKTTKNDIVNLTWKYKSSENIIGFNIYKSNNDSVYSIINEEIIDADSRNYIVHEPIPGNYYYYVTALDSNFNEGKSSKIFIEVKDLIPPKSPITISAIADTGRIDLAWHENLENDLWGYLIYRRIKNKVNDEFVLLMSKPILDTLYTDTLASNTRNMFEYQIVAIDESYNKSKGSSIISARMPDIVAPTKPFIKKVYIKDNNILLEWIPNVENDLKGYNIYKKQYIDTVEINRKMNIGLIKNGVNRFTDKDFEYNTKYHYYIEALDTNNNVSNPSEIFAFKTPYVIKGNELKIKLNAKYKKSNNSININWSVNGKDIKGIIVYRKKDSGQYLPISGLLNSKKFIDKNIEVSISNYSYQIHVFDNLGTETISETVKINKKLK